MNEKFESNFNYDIALNIETDNSSLVYPFVKIIQRSSNELIEGTEKYNPNVKAGDIYDSITKTTFKEAKVIICGMKRFFAEWTNETRGKLVNRHLLNSNIVKNCRKEERKKSDGSIGYNLFTEDNNQLIETIGCVFIIKNNDGLILPCRFNFSKSNYVIGKELMTNIQLYNRNGIPIFSLKTLQVSNTKGSWYKPVFTFENYENDKNIIEMAININKKAEDIIMSI